MSAAAIAKKVGCTTGLVYNVKAAMGKTSGAVKRGPGRPPKAASSVAGLDGLAGIVNAVRSAEKERSHLRGVLEKAAGGDRGRIGVTTPAPRLSPWLAASEGRRRISRR